MSEGVITRIHKKFPKLPHFPIEWEDFTDLTEVVTQYECFIREAFQFRDDVLAALTPLYELWQERPSHEWMIANLDKIEEVEAFLQKIDRVLGGVES